MSLDQTTYNEVNKKKMENQNENKNLPLVEKQSFLAQETGFRVITKEPRDSWKTNYAYYLQCKRTGAPVRPIIGRKTDEGTFETYNMGEWETTNYNQYIVPALDNDGNAITINGKPKMQHLFDHKHDYVVEFLEPVKVTYYNTELKQSVTEDLKKFYIRMSRSLSAKLQEQMEDPRNSDETNFQVIYDPSKSPADQYKVKFHS